MDIYIRTQNKEQLIKIQKDITITDAKKYKKMFNIIDVDVMSSEYDKVDGIDIIREIASVEGYLLTTDKLLLGTYKTKERALEVLDEIQSILMNKKLIKLKANLSQFDMNRLKKAFGTDAIVETTLYEIANSTNIIIYEMPKE